ncbi:SWI/SNF-related matrix-associated actin-dependent regulator of chromatin subfamily A-like protein 1 [Phlebotomus argentipes]|uniref:SWI/SNF-related matrix-associated actin-dependent regulator of chromatin subfamily A-like protein 1 n=1 Tax=Phlebotomus argentipes TaxID=94469 RepID=UPI002892A574|nr:SWI/SNF-related matrix-associated actin-dependent regulator of chromatin subfamily A-like protein 1 [Phlebotomus argentipes]
MACSPEQIALKRQQALERLRANQVKNTEANTSTATITSGQFYGSGQSSPAMHQQKTLPGKVDNKIKPQPLKDNRIFSQPYANRGKASDVEKKEPKVWPGALAKTVCKCALVSEERFGVTLSNFDQAVNDAMKMIASRSFNQEQKVWSFLLKDYKNFLKAMEPLAHKVTVEHLPPFILKLFSGQKESTDMRMDMSFLSSIEPKLADALMDFQKEGVRFAIEKQGRCIIADEMGLGKTYQALAVADFYRDDWPVLICTTAITRDAWAAKVRELLPRVPVHKIAVLDSAQSLITDASIIISSYAMMDKCMAKIQSKKCGILIMDESHSLKNNKTKCAAAALNFVKKARRVIMLTGTPALSRPSELFTQLQMCDSSFFSFKEYSKRYCDGHEGKFAWDSSGKSNLTELNLLLSRKFMIRRTKNEVMDDMTEKRREVVILDKDLVSSRKEFGSLLDKYSQSSGKQQREILLTFYSETAVAKVKAVCSYVKSVMKEKKKVVIFAYHHVMLDGLSECLRDFKIDFIRIDGETKAELRSSMVNMFQTKPHYRVALLSLKACNAGITLTAAQLVLFAELYWNPSTLAQGESRAHRIGQDENVVVRYLLAKGTADDIIWNMIQKKQTVLNDAGVGCDDFSEVASCTEVSSLVKISKFFPKTPAKEAQTPQVGSSKAPVEACDDLKKLLDEDDDILADMDF